MTPGVREGLECRSPSPWANALDVCVKDIAHGLDLALRSPLFIPQ